MYYVNLQRDSLWIHESATGAPHFTIPLYGQLTFHNTNGNTLTMCYSNGTVEVWDMESRSRIR
jgi:hypothetical protein